LIRDNDNTRQKNQRTLRTKQLLKGDLSNASKEDIMKYIFILTILMTTATTTAASDMEYDPVSGTHVMVNDQSQPIGIAVMDQEDPYGPADEKADEPFDPGTGEQLYPDGLGGFNGSDGSHYTSDGIGGYYNSETGEYFSK